MNSDLHEKGLETIKSSRENPVSLPVFAPLYDEERMTIDADACDTRARCVLLQAHLNKTKPVRLFLF